MRSDAERKAWIEEVGVKARAASDAAERSLANADCTFSFHSFSEGLATAEIKEEYGFIDHRGQFVLKCENGSPHSFSKGLAKIYVFGVRKCGFINHGGHFVIPPDFETIGRFSDGLAPVNIGGKTSVMYDGKIEFLYGSEMGGKWGCIDCHGRMVISPQSITLWSFPKD